MIIHKLTDVILEADQNDSQSLELVQRFQVSGSLIVFMDFKQEDDLSALNSVFPVQLIGFDEKSSLAHCCPTTDGPAKIVFFSLNGLAPLDRFCIVLVRLVRTGFPPNVVVISFQENECCSQKGTGVCRVLYMLLSTTEATKLIWPHSVWPSQFLEY